MSNRVFHADCLCRSLDHYIRFSRLDFEDADSTDIVYVHYFLDTKPWYKRILISLKYLLGFKCVYGNFGECLLSKEAAKELASFLLNPENKDNA